MRQEEGKFKTDLIKELETRLPGCIIQKGDANKRQGIPDLLILHKAKWAALEVKKGTKSARQPNQEYYIKKMNDMSYAAIVSPENRELILDEVQRALGT